jgi:hypothetical protein
VGHVTYMEEVRNTNTGFVMKNKCRRLSGRHRQICECKVTEYH